MKATLELQISICLSISSSQKPISLTELLLSTIKPIDHQACWQLSLLTLNPIDIWSSFTTFQPFGLVISFWDTLYCTLKRGIVRIVVEQWKLNSVPRMKIRFIGILKIDPNQAYGTAFLFCSPEMAKQFLNFHTMYYTFIWCNNI